MGQAQDFRAGGWACLCPQRCSPAVPAQPLSEESQACRSSGLCRSLRHTTTTHPHQPDSWGSGAARSAPQQTGARPTTKLAPLWETALEKGTLYALAGSEP